jgi:hypothetical protein
MAGPTSTPRQSPSYPKPEHYEDDGSSKKNDFSGYKEHKNYDSPGDRPWRYVAHREPSGGYSVYTDRLYQIAKHMEDDLKDLEKELNKVISAGPITEANVGETLAGKGFVELVKNAHDGFTQYYHELQNGYRTVISNLYKSAGEYKKAEEYSTPKYKD